MATLIQILAEVGNGRAWLIDSQTGVTLQASLDREDHRSYTVRMVHVEGGPDYEVQADYLEQAIRCLAQDAPGITRHTFTAWMTQAYEEA